MAWERVRKEQASSSARTRQKNIVRELPGLWAYVCAHTPESVDGPLFKLLKRDVCCWRGRVEVESVGILDFFVRGVCKLLLAVVDVGSPFAFVSVKVLTDHIGDCVIPWAAKSSIALLCLD